jgi:hypothetical protein
VRTVTTEGRTLATTAGTEWAFSWSGTGIRTESAQATGPVGVTAASKRNGMTNEGTEERRVCVADNCVIRFL